MNSNLVVRQSQPAVDQNTGSALPASSSEVSHLPDGECTVAPPKLDEMPAEAGADEITVIYQQSPPGSAQHFLRTANNLMAERGKQYDKPEGERSMGKAVHAFNTIIGRDAITESEGWLLMQILKDVRQWQRPGFHADSAEDCIAYAALKAESKAKEAS